MNLPEKQEKNDTQLRTNEQAFQLHLHLLSCTVSVQAEHQAFTDMRGARLEGQLSCG